MPAFIHTYQYITCNLLHVIKQAGAELCQAQGKLKFICFSSFAIAVRLQSDLSYLSPIKWVEVGLTGTELFKTQTFTSTQTYMYISTIITLISARPMTYKLQYLGRYSFRTTSSSHSLQVCFFQQFTWKNNVAKIRSCISRISAKTIELHICVLMVDKDILFNLLLPRIHCR